MSHALRSRSPFAACTVRGARAWFVVCVLWAIAWPSTGPLPWVMIHSDAHPAVEGATPPHEHAAAADRHDADVPGSPTHPLDHGCAQCEVLKHLARCVLPQSVEVSVAPPSGDPVVALVEMELSRPSFIATPPPIRGPPLRSA